MRAAPAAEVYGRRAIPNPGDLWYLLADRTPEVFDLHPPPARLILRGEPYNRPDEPTDVACALLAALHASPQRIGPSRLPSVAWLDRAIRTLEGAVGPSVSIRSGCGVLKQLGVITGYAWTYDAGEIVRWLQTGQRGLVLGIDWYAAMSRPDRTGMIRAWGKAMGGRAITPGAMMRRPTQCWCRTTGVLTGAAGPRGRAATTSGGAPDCPSRI